MVLSNHTSSVASPPIRGHILIVVPNSRLAFPTIGKASPREGRDEANPTLHFKVKLINSSKPVCTLDFPISIQVAFPIN